MTTAPVHDRTLDITRPTLEQIVVGVDGSYAAGEALAWAARLARAAKCPVSAVYAWQTGLGDSVGERHLQAARRRSRLLGQWCEPARHLGIEPAVVVREGEAHAVLAAVGDDASARLIVVGHAGRGVGLAHDADHQADRIARHTHRPLAIVPSPGGARVLERVVVGLDGSAASMAACRYATWLARSAGTDVIAVTAFEALLEWVPSTAPNSWLHNTQMQLEGPWTEPFRTTGVEHSTELVEGSDYMEVLAHIARQRHADAIVVGTAGPRGHRHHPGRPTGASRLVHRSQLPVIVVPPRPSPNAAPRPDTR